MLLLNVGKKKVKVAVYGHVSKKLWQYYRFSYITYEAPKNGTRNKEILGIGIFKKLAS